MNELNSVILTKNIEKYGLKKGDMGTIVHIYKKEGLEVEFTTAEGKTVAVITLKPSEVRSIARGEMLHVRQIATL